MAAFREEIGAGWRELLGAAIGLGFGIGSYTPVSSLFFLALEGQFGWSKSAAVASLFALPLTGLALPLAGILTDRVGARTIAVCSAAGLGVSLFGLSLLHGSLFPFYILFFAMNVLGCGTGPLTYTRAVVAAFRSSRGIALSIALMGISVSGVLLPVVFGPMLAAGHWRSAYHLYAAIVLAGGAVAWLLIRGKKTKAGSAPLEQAGVDLRIALASRTFWILAATMLFISAASLGMLTQFQAVMVERGLSLIYSARLISLLAISVSLSRLAIGRALDVASPHRVAAWTMALAAAGAGLLLVRGGDVLLISEAAAALIGVSLGAELDLLSFFCSRAFGLRRYGSIYGALALFFYVGIAVGGISYGKAHDLFGSYRAAIAMSVVLLISAAGLFLNLGVPDSKLRSALTIL